MSSKLMSSIESTVKVEVEVERRSWNVFSVQSKVIAIVFRAVPVYVGWWEKMLKTRGVVERSGISKNKNIYSLSICFIIFLKFDFSSLKMLCGKISSRFKISLIWKTFWYKSDVLLMLVFRSLILLGSNFKGTVLVSENEFQLKTFLHPFLVS